ncbi:MAG TPA: ABC transporter ATP-binding protein [Bacilli bacterium]|nr:ABC transporter ATP-binding protein [Bacilli bacterium]
MLDLQEVTGGYAPGQEVIRKIAFSVREREITGMVGLNGAGKSTIIKHILGLLEPISGEIRVQGKTLTDDPLFYRGQMAYIPETPKLYEELTLWEHLELTAMVYQVEKTALHERAAQLLELFRLTERVDDFPTEFSKGMQQKVMILCALLVQPPLLIVDEPFVGLDPLAIQSLLELFEEMKRQGTALLLSTHILGTAEKYCDRFVMIHQGEVALRGTLPEMREQAQMPGATLDEMFVSVVRGQ